MQNLRIVVLIKQVPETSNVKMDPETGTVIRSGVETVVNPLDLYAIETALLLKERYAGSVTALTMGPSQAAKALKEALAMGCDEAVLLSDRRFGGSDTWATSYTLAQAIRKIGPFDLVVAGERATDGDTSQVGPGVASWLDLPLATYVANIEGVVDGSLTLERLVEEGYQRVRMNLPAAITVVKEIASPRLPTLRGKRYAKGYDLKTLGADDLDLDPSRIGLRGSPTKVVKVTSAKVARNGTVVQAMEDDEVPAAVDRLLAFLEAKGLV